MAESDALSRAVPDDAAMRGLQVRARWLLALVALLIAASAAYLLYARGWFEPTQDLVLVTDDSEGVLVGMDMTFSGFPIGRVRRVALGPAGEVRILIEVARKDARWLRTSSVFTLVRSLVGGTAIRAFTGVLDDPPLPDGAQRTVLRGDATADIPRVMASAREALENLVSLTAQDAALRTTLANLQAVSERARGPQGAMGALFGNDQDARALAETLQRTNALLARIEQLARHADTQVFGAEGALPQARAAIRQLHGLLTDARGSLRKADAVLADAQVVSGQVRSASADLGQLRAEVEVNLHRIQGLLDDISRRWPFARDTEIKLP